MHGYEWKRLAPQSCQCFVARDNRWGVEWAGTALSVWDFWCLSLKKDFTLSLHKNRESQISLGLGTGKVGSCPKRWGMVGDYKMTTDLLSTLPVPEPWKNNIMEVATGFSSSGRSGVSLAEAAAAAGTRGIRVASASLEQSVYQTYLPILRFLRVTKSTCFSGALPQLYDSSSSSLLGSSPPSLIS